MSLAARARHGLDVIVSSRRGYYKPFAIGDDGDPTAPVRVQDQFDDGFTQAVTELVGSPDDQVGFDMSSLSAAAPYLSSFASGFGGGDKKKDSGDDDKKRELERQKEEAERKAASSRTTLWVVLGLLGAGALATIIVLLARKK